MPLVDPAFWRGKRVLLTGHTGFKGAWMALWLTQMGARVSGFARPADTVPSLYAAADVARIVPDGIGDLRNLEDVAAAVDAADPEVVIHMAAQSLLLRSLQQPVVTFETNVMGTVHLLEALRHAANLSAVLVVTTDKIYKNLNPSRPFFEGDALGGHDPYSASKAAVEVATSAYARSFFEPRGIAVATARGGNVIGGGDFAADRLVPDIYRAKRSGQTLVLRHPHATRPWQHVLDCLAGYLAYVQLLSQRDDAPRSLNFGPSNNEPVPVTVLVGAMQTALGIKPGWCVVEPDTSQEVPALALDCSLARQVLGWRDRLIGETAIRAAADWYLAFDRGCDMGAYTLKSISDYVGS